MLRGCWESYGGDIAARLEGVLDALGLPRSVGDSEASSMPEVTTEKVLAEMRRDKKSLGGCIQWVLPTQVGEYIITGLKESDFLEAVESVIDG